MSSQSWGVNLKLKEEVFYEHQGYNSDGSGNYIIIKGCTRDDVVGTQQRAEIKFVGIYTPDAAKQSGQFNIQVYKHYDSLVNELSDLIIQGVDTIPQSYFTSG